MGGGNESKILIEVNGDELTQKSFNVATKHVAVKFSGEDARRNLYASALKYGRDYYMKTGDFVREGTKFVIKDRGNIVLEIIPDSWSRISRK